MTITPPKSPGKNADGDLRPTAGTVQAMGWIFVLVLLFLFAVLIGLWPMGPAEPAKLENGQTNPIVETLLFSKIHMEVALFLIVTVCGALGSIIFTARSFSVRIANDTYAASWIWWSIIRVPVGAGIALIFYLLLRGGLFNATFADPQKAMDTINPFGFAAIATLAGMFAKQASAKLSEIFDILFKTDRFDDQESAPKIAEVKPDKIKKDTSAPEQLMIVLSGKNFPKKAQVSVSGNERESTVNETGDIVVQLIAEDAKVAGELEIQIIDESDTSVKSNSVNVVIE